MNKQVTKQPNYLLVHDITASPNSRYNFLEERLSKKIKNLKLGGTFVNVL